MKHHVNIENNELDIALTWKEEQRCWPCYNSVSIKTVPHGHCQLQKEAKEANICFFQYSKGRQRREKGFESGLWINQ